MHPDSEMSDSELRYQAWLSTPEGQLAQRQAKRAERLRIALECLGWLLLAASFLILSVAVAVW